jgi:serine/threonine-protein kinase
VSDAVTRLSAAVADRYVIERELGAGGMATVYLAHDVRHDRKVALKVLRPELAAVLGGERFLAEIKTTANLQHPHILPLHDSGEAEGIVYYVMPYVEGETLRDRLNREKQLPVEEAVRIAREVASALDYAHRRGVVHRDIKPENILLHEGQALVADFGIALAVSSAGGGTRMTETGMSLGTPHYMSPEQAMGEREITAKSDVYALACVLYEMLVGEPPFTGPTAQAIVARVMTEEPRSLTIQRKTIPPHVEGAVEVALAKLPADRFASAAQFAEALARPELMAQSPVTRATAAVAAGLGPGALRRRALAAMPWVLLAVALAGGALGWLRRSPPPPVSRYTVALATGQAIQPGQGPRLAISPDGARFVYVGPGDGGGQLWVRERDQLSARQLPGTDGAICPFFSPDGRRVGFYTITPMRLKVVSLSGEPPVTVADSGLDWDGGSWGSDGYIYSDSPDGLVRVRPGGGTLERVTRFDSARTEGSHSYPDVLPNAKGALFTIGHTNGGIGDQEIAVVDFRTGVHRVLAKGVYARYAAAGYLVYVTANGTLLAAPFDQNSLRLTGEATALAEGVGIRALGYVDLALSRTGTLVYVGGGTTAATADLVWVSRAGVVETIDSGAYDGPVLSPDGRRIAAAVTTMGEQQIWIRLLPHGPSSKLTFEGNTNARPFWSPDGRSVSFYSSRTRVRGLFSQRADGSAPAETLLVRRQEVLEGQWSRDGRWVVFRQSPVPAADLLAFQPGRDTTPVTLVASRFNERSPALSPDGSWLAYTSDESGRSEVYVRPFPGATRAKWQVSLNGGTEPVWAHSGRELFFRGPAGEMIAAALTTQPSFAVARQAVLFPGSLYLSDDSHREYDVSPDDRRFLMVRERGGGERANLILAENWFGELRAKVGRQSR